jgi:hypothetical protein
MKLTPTTPRRTFYTGKDRRQPLHDCGRIALEADEQVTFVTEAGGEYDVARKAWGFYATPSLNGRLARFGLRGALVRNAEGKVYVMLVETGRESDFQSYLVAEAQRLIAWLDDEATLRKIEGAVADGGR